MQHAGYAKICENPVKTELNAALQFPLEALLADMKA